MSSNSSSFTSAIEEHLELKRRNRHLDSDQPLESFAGSDPFHNNPLFKSEQEARREEEETGEQPALELPADTAAMPRVEPDGEPASWMETSGVGDFSWD